MQVDAIGGVRDEVVVLTDRERATVEVYRLRVVSGSQHCHGIVVRIDVAAVCVDRVLVLRSAPNKDTVTIAADIYLSQIRGDISGGFPLDAHQRLIPTIAQGPFQGTILNDRLVLERKGGRSVVELRTTARDLGRRLSGARHRDPGGKFDVRFAAHVIGGCSQHQFVARERRGQRGSQRGSPVGVGVGRRIKRFDRRAVRIQRDLAGQGVRANRHHIGSGNLRVDRRERTGGASGVAVNSLRSSSASTISP